MGSRDQVKSAGAECAAKIASYRDLIAWQKSYELALLAYAATKSFPTDERFGLTQQIRRGAVSVASNIAEGYGRGGRQDYVRFLKVARGALYELETQFQLANDLMFLPSTDYDRVQRLIGDCERVLAALIRAVEAPLLAQRHS